MNLDNKVIARIGDTQDVQKATNGAATVTLAAPGARLRWLVESLTISMSGDPAAAVEFSITSGAAVIERIQFPAAACAPFSTCAIYRGGINEAVVLTLPALGAGIVGCVSVRANKVPDTAF